MTSLLWRHLTEYSRRVLFSPSVYYRNSRVINNIRTTEKKKKFNTLMLKRWCFKSQHIVQVRSNICSICQQASECLMQRTMLAAVQATVKRLIAPRYLMGQNVWTNLDDMLNKKAVLSQRRPRDAPYISLPWKFWRVPDYAHSPFFPKYLTAFCSNWACECSGQIWSS